MTVSSRQSEQTHAQRAYQHLRTQLLTGQYGPGTRIRYGPIGKQLGMSATPVREAIGQLANEGFVTLIPQLGAVVREISLSEMRELYELREAIEPYAAAKAAERMRPAQLVEIEQQYEQMQALAEGKPAPRGRPVSDRITPTAIARFEQADLAFHMLILEAAGNQTLLKTVGNSHVLVRIFSARRHPYNRDVLRSTCDDHLRILQALQAGNAEAARVASAAHVRHSLQRTLPADPEPHRWWET